jgi:hypothetical protein
MSNPPRSEPEATPTQQSNPELLLPDLQVDLPEDLHIQQNSATGGRELRFSTTFLNVGEGPLVIVGDGDPASGEMAAAQRIERRRGGRLERPAGSLAMDGEHGHWHMQDFTTFELWTHDDTGDLGELVASTGKGSFCAMDTAMITPATENAAKEAGFWECDAFEQGISAGWSDIYPASLPGQQLDLADVPDGPYAVRTVVDPLDLLLELDETNNDAVAYIEIAGTDVERRSRPRG